jgi:hypothetical protein
MIATPQLLIPAARKRPGLAGSWPSKARGRREWRMLAAPIANLQQESKRADLFRCG